MFVIVSVLIIFFFDRDDVPADVKQRRLQEVIDTFNKHCLENNKKEVGNYHLVLVEGVCRNIFICGFVYILISFFIHI